MARITTNTTGTQPYVVITTAFDANATPLFGTGTATSGALGNLAVMCLQDVTVTNSTGVYSYTSFCDTDTRKVSIPADNEISMNIVIDDTAWFGNANGTANSAAQKGVQTLSSDKTLIGFRMYYNNSTGTASGAKYKQGQGFITSLAATVSPEAPVWVTPVTIAVDGGYTNSNN